MKATGQSYDYEASFGRIRSILDQSDVEYEEVDELPSRDDLTFTNGFYANCSALFVDIRDSSSLPKKYARPKLARLYRSYISEVVALMNSDPDCHEINVAGDGIWCVVNTDTKSDIDWVFSTAARIASLLKVLNCELKKRSYDPIRTGLGMSYGRALMIKAGYKGTGLNDVVYMGDVVNEAAKLSSHGNETWSDRQMMVSSTFYGNLNDHNKSLLK